MNILVQGAILNYPDIHLLGKTSLDPTMVPAFHPAVYQTVTSQIQPLWHWFNPDLTLTQLTYSWIFSKVIKCDDYQFMSLYKLYKEYKTTIKCTYNFLTSKLTE